MYIPFRLTLIVCFSVSTIVRSIRVEHITRSIILMYFPRPKAVSVVRMSTIATTSSRERTGFCRWHGRTAFEVHARPAPGTWTYTTAPQSGSVAHPGLAADRLSSVFCKSLRYRARSLTGMKLAYRRDCCWVYRLVAVPLTNHLRLASLKGVLARRANEGCTRTEPDIYISLEHGQWHGIALSAGAE